MVVQAGIVAMKKASDEVARLAPGDFFGEQGTLSGVEEKHTSSCYARCRVRD